MRITESRLRRIIRSVILESNTQPKYTYELKCQFGDYDIDHDELIAFLEGYEIDPNLFEDLKSDPKFLYSVMKGGKFESTSTTLVDAYQAERDGNWDAAPDSWVDKFEEIANNIINAENEIYNSDKDDVQSIISIYKKYFDDDSFKQSFINVLETFGYSENAIKAALSEVGLASISYDDHDYSA